MPPFWSHVNFNLWRSCSRNGSKLGPSFAMLEPSWAEVGAKWAPRSKAHVAAMSDRNSAFGRCWAGSAKRTNFHSPVHFFWRPGQWTEDCSNRSAPTAKQTRKKGQIGPDTKVFSVFLDLAFVLERPKAKRCRNCFWLHLVSEPTLIKCQSVFAIFCYTRSSTAFAQRQIFLFAFSGFPFCVVLA